MSTRLIVLEGSELVADIEDFQGAIPRVGEYLVHPPFPGERKQDTGREPWDGGTAGCVKTVTHAIYTRPPQGDARGHFVGRNTNVVEVRI